MIANKWLKGLASWLRETDFLPRQRTGCVDCPIVMSCGREPQAQCLPRLEALAAGRRRQAGSQDTCITEFPR